MCFVWIWEQTAIISLYSINWLVFYNRDAVCLLRSSRWIPIGFRYFDILHNAKSWKSTYFFLWAGYEL